jgi:hypothetical protein
VSHTNIEFWKKTGVDKKDDVGMLVFSGVPHASVFCTATGAFGADRRSSRCAAPSDVVYLQVVVDSGLGSPSSSPRVPAALRCRTSKDHEGSQDCWAVPSKTPAPMNVGWLESFMLQVNWPVFMHRVSLILWALGLWLLLLLPRRVALAHNGAWIRRVYSSPLFQAYAASPHTPCGSVRSSSPALRRAMDAETIPTLPPLTLASRLSATLLWPGAALVLVASLPRVWASIVSCLFSTFA